MSFFICFHSGTDLPYLGSYRVKKYESFIVVSELFNVRGKKRKSCKTCRENADATKKRSECLGLRGCLRPLQKQILFRFEMF